MAFYDYPYNEIFQNTFSPNILNVYYILTNPQKQLFLNFTSLKIVNSTFRIGADLNEKYFKV